MARWVLKRKSDGKFLKHGATPYGTKHGHDFGDLQGAKLFVANYVKPAGISRATLHNDFVWVPVTLAVHFPNDEELA